MARTPVIPNPKTDQDCDLCGDTGAIFRPEWEFDQFVLLQEYDEHSQLVSVEHTATTRMGGIDACPACAARAEANYETGERDRKEDREVVRLKVVK